jgi:hypothetical protein
LDKLELLLQSINLKFEVFDGVCVVGFKHLQVGFNFCLDLLLAHLGAKEQVDELVELNVFSWDICVPAYRPASLGLVSLVAFLVYCLHR